MYIMLTLYLNNACIAIRNNDNVTNMRLNHNNQLHLGSSLLLKYIPLVKGYNVSLRKEIPSLSQFEFYNL